MNMLPAKICNNHRVSDGATGEVLLWETIEAQAKQMTCEHDWREMYPVYACCKCLLLKEMKTV